VELHTVDLKRGGEVRLLTGLRELDNVLGGGIVASSLVLIGGDPGVGKSTLLLMAIGRLAARGHTVLYATGEESAVQVRLRADRLGVSGQGVWLLPTTDFTHVEAIIQEHRPAVVVVDSVQTLSLPEVPGIAGSVSQVRGVAHRAMRLAKTRNTAVILVGHINKSGAIAGPKVLEHFVDTVLQFEGDGSHELRVLRSVKNRFGASGELGLFEMASDGLIEVPDASARLLRERLEDAPGTAVVAALEGQRPLLIEIQALAGRTPAPVPARTASGVDRTRVLLVVAVLQKLGLSLHDQDVFVNAAGGVRVLEPAADLGIAAALISSLVGNPIEERTVFFGEIGLVGEVRSVSQPERRIREAARQGFVKVLGPASLTTEVPGVQIVPIRSVRDLIAHLT
jgi:DNA repair protein RadA/Sms